MNISQRQSRRQQQTITNIKMAFIDLILENNALNEITVSEITGKADLNRGTFYIHYNDKRSLIEDLFSDALGGIEKALLVPYKNVEKIVLEESFLLQV